MLTVPNIVNNSLHHVYSFFFFIFSDFLTIFTLITIFENVCRPSQQYPTLSITVYIMSILFFLVFFPDFLAIFALITILGNAHRPCNQCPNIITNNEHHPYFDSDFMTIFCVNMQNLPYLAIFSIHSCHAFQCHSVPVHSGDCSGVSTGI